MTKLGIHALYCRVLHHPGYAMACLLLCLTTVSWPAHAESDQEEKGVDLTTVSIEDLMNMTVTSVSRTEQTMANAAAAVFVITNEDIRRSGATSIPEALRMVPGLEVAHIDSNKWAISSRGFNGRFASILLVQIDGCTVYNPLFSGVFWDAQDTVLEDIERIEVIWGAGYRFIHERLQYPSPATLTIGPNDSSSNLFSFFVQDNISLVPNQLNLIIGSKFEHNDYSGFEVQPNARLIWTPTRKQSVWLSVSRVTSQIQ